MTKPLAHFNDVEFPTLDFGEILNLISNELIDELRKRFDIEGENETIRLGLAKALRRYQSAVKNSRGKTPNPQTKEIKQLEKSVEKALLAFDRLSSDTKSDLNHEILYRDPFNERFFFPEQLKYWAKNERSCQTTINKLEQISFAIKKLRITRKENAPVYKQTVNTPLDHLIQDLTFDFRQGTNRKLHCYHNEAGGTYEGKYFEFVVFILNRFASKSYHSEFALGQRIKRAIAKGYN
jgi:hypothetical protein